MRGRKSADDCRPVATDVHGIRLGPCRCNSTGGCSSQSAAPEVHVAVDWSSKLRIGGAYGSLKLGRVLVLEGGRQDLAPGTLQLLEYLVGLALSDQNKQR